MIKTLHLVTRKAGITHDECVKHHRQVHAPLVADFWGPRIKRYVAYYLNEVATVATIERAATELPFDMVVEIWWEDDAWNNLSEYAKGPEFKKIIESEIAHINLEKVIPLIFDDNVIV